jgi:hypothetical protein
LLVCGNATEFCVLILYTATFLKVLFHLSVLGGVLKSFRYKITTSKNRDNLISFFLI